MSCSSCESLKAKGRSCWRHQGASHDVTVEPAPGGAYFHVVEEYRFDVLTKSLPVASVRKIVAYVGGIAFPLMFDAIAFAAGEALDMERRLGIELALSLPRGPNVDPDGSFIIGLRAGTFSVNPVP